MSTPLSMVSCRRAVANGTTPAVTIPKEFSTALGLKPGMFCRITLQVDGSVLFQLSSYSEDDKGRVYMRIMDAPGAIDSHHARTHLDPVLVYGDESPKKVIRMGQSPAVSINREIADKIGLKIHDHVSITLHRDGSILFRKLTVTKTSVTTRLSPEAINISPRNPLMDPPVIPPDALVSRDLKRHSRRSSA